jgi:formate/nitrite transporter FocA (FNT family)
MPTGRASSGPPERGLALWFSTASRPPVAYGLLAAAAVGYSIVAYLLSLAGAQPMPEPYFRLADAAYFRWGTVFYGPVILSAWLLAGSAMYLMAWGFGKKPQFDELLRASAFATGLATFGTLLPDLITSPLRALGVIDEQAWETSIAQHVGWVVFTWVTLVAYLILFLVLYPMAVRQATNLPWKRALAIGVAGFLVFQGVEYVFIR